AVPRAAPVQRRHELRRGQVLRLRSVVAGHAGVAGVQLVLQLRGLPGPPHGHALPPRAGRQGRAPAHAQRLGRGAAAHVRRAARAPPAGGRLGGAAQGPASVSRRPRGVEARRVRQPPPGPGVRAALREGSRMVRPIGSGPSQGKQLLKTALFTGGSLLVVAVFMFTQSAVKQLTREVSKTSDLLARVAAQATLPSTINPQVQRVLGELAQGISFPIIITDTTGTPRAWSHISVRSEDVSPGSLDSLAPALPLPPPPPHP